MRLTFIDGLRGVAAGAVVLQHLMERTPAPMHYGYLGVAVFFVLSGFVISMSVGTRPISASFLGRFALRRAIRLDPPYWLSIATAIVLMFVAARLFGLQKEYPDLSDILLHMVYLQDIAGAQPISTVYWTLCLEVQFYLFLIVLLWAFGERVSSFAFQVALAALMVFSLAELTDLTDFTPSGLFVSYWFAFGLGAITHWTIAGRLKEGYFWAAAVVVALCGFMPHGEWCAVSAVTAVVIQVAAKLGKMDSWLSDQGMQFLGRISYSLYLFHPLVGWTAQSVALKYLDQWSALAAGIAASVLSAWAAYWLIEKRSIQWSKLVTIAPRSLPAQSPHQEPLEPHPLRPEA